MATRSAPRRYTYEEFAALPDDGKRYELIDGVPVVTPSPIPAHQLIAMNLILELRRAVDVPAEGIVLQDCDVRLETHRAAFQGWPTPGC